MTDEQVFFDTLSIMESAAIDGIETLILTGSDGRSMEFVQDRQSVCKTCTAD